MEEDRQCWLASTAQFKLKCCCHVGFTLKGYENTNVAFFASMHPTQLGRIFSEVKTICYGNFELILASFHIFHAVSEQLWNMLIVGQSVCTFTLSATT